MKKSIKNCENKRKILKSCIPVSFLYYKDFYYKYIDCLNLEDLDILINKKYSFCTLSAIFGSCNNCIHKFLDDDKFNLCKERIFDYVIERYN
jgi:hypothetical protein